MKVPKGGGPIVTIATGQSGPWGIAVEASNVYWVLQTGTLMRAPLNGGTAVTIATNPSALNDVKVDATNIHWSGGDLFKLPK